MSAETSVNFAVKDISIEWKIPDLYPLRTDDFKVDSPVIEYLGAKWKFGLFKDDEFYEMFIVANFTYSPQRYVNYTIGIKKADGSVYKSVNGRKAMIHSNKLEQTQRFIRPDILMRDKMYVAPDDSLVIFCKLSLNRNSSENSLTNDVIQTENDDITYKLKEDLERLFLGGIDFDTTIKVCEREFKVHRAILGARSSVFQSMFSDDTTEHNNGIIEIENCDPEVFQYFLRFLYCGKVEQLSLKSAIQVYELANKYCVGEMKIAYVNIMERNFNVDNFCDVIDVTLKYNELELLKSAAKFFSDNTKEILMTNKWKCFQKLHPVEANELLVKAIEYRDNMEEKTESK